MKLKQFFTTILTAAIITTAAVTPVHAAGQFTVSPTKYNLTATPGETLTEQVVVANLDSDPMAFSVSASPYWLEATADRTGHFEPRLGNYNDMVDWVTFPTSTTGYLAPSQTTKFPFEITVPACAASSHQWMALLVEDTTEYDPSDLLHVTTRVGAIINLELQNNHPENCGGTADDPNPYTIVVDIDPTTGEEFEATYRTEYVDELRVARAEEEASQAALKTQIENPLGEMTWLIWVIVAAILVAGLIVLVVFLIRRSKSKSNPKSKSDPKSNSDSNSHSPSTPQPTDQFPTSSTA